MSSWWSDGISELLDSPAPDLGLLWMLQGFYKVTSLKSRPWQQWLLLIPKLDPSDPKLFEVQLCQKKSIQGPHSQVECAQIVVAGDVVRFQTAVAGWHMETEPTYGNCLAIQYHTISTWIRLTWVTAPQFFTKILSNKSKQLDILRTLDSRTKSFPPALVPRSIFPRRRASPRLPLICRPHPAMLTPDASNRTAESFAEHFRLAGPLWNNLAEIRVNCFLFNCHRKNMKNTFGSLPDRSWIQDLTNTSQAWPFLCTKKDGMHRTSPALRRKCLHDLRPGRSHCRPLTHITGWEPKAMGRVACVQQWCLQIVTQALYQAQRYAHFKQSYDLESDSAKEVLTKQRWMTFGTKAQQATAVTDWKTKDGPQTDLYLDRAL